MSDVNRIKSFLEVLIDNLSIMKSQMEDVMSDYALVVGDFDPRLQQAYEKEWPKELADKADNYIGYTYYSAMRLRPSLGAQYIRRRYEEASRDVTGNGVVDFLNLVHITEKEALLIKDFISSREDTLGTAAEQEILENFEVWIQTAIVQTKRLYEDFKAATEETATDRAERDTTASSEEARRTQAISKIRLNQYNKAILNTFNSLRRNFGDQSDVFYSKFMNKTKVIPDKNDLQIQAILQDQDLRTRQFQEKIDVLINQMSLADDARREIASLAGPGRSLPVDGPRVMVRNVDTSAELQYDPELAPNVEFDWRGTHNSMLDLAEGDPHPHYLLKAQGGTITGDITAADGVKIDKVDPSEHRHTGNDGSAQIHGDDVIRDTLIDEAVDLEDKPASPDGLTVSRTDLKVVSPGVNVADTFFSWDGDKDFTYEIDIHHIPETGEE